ncbi:MAG: transporter substrate-binding protein, partial [Verrucomicrobiaceae bacterium]|nr:transporter substrate-binding protein [Verrucomicrobiaceae bacterium]
MKLKNLIHLACIAASSAVLPTAHSETLKLGYSDWPGYTVLEVAKQKGWFKEAGLDVELVWFDYLPSLDAFSAGKIDGVCVVATDALVNGANGAKS